MKKITHGGVIEMQKDFTLKAKKAIKKIAAVSVGVAMLGATVTSAVALDTDLGDYPAPYVMSGSFDPSTTIVFADGADAADVAGAVDIVQNIQFESKVCTGTGSTVSSVSEGVKIETSGNDLNLWQSIQEIDAVLRSSDLDLLADGTYVDDEGTNTDEIDYEQTITFVAGEGNLTFNENKDTDVMDVHLYFPGSSNAWIYQLDFDKKVTVANDADVETTTIDILGQTYTITDATVSGGNISKMTLMSGDVVQTVMQGETVSGVTVINVDEDETKCILEYNGDQYTVDKSTTKKMSDGTIIGVTDVTAVHESGQAEDSCELSIGAYKITLEDNKRVDLNGIEVDKSTANIIEPATGGGWDKLNISYKVDDNVYLAAGDEIVDPVFGAFKIVFAGLDVEREDIIIKPDGSDSFEITMNNADGDTYTTGLIFYDTTNSRPGAKANLAWGEDKDNQLIVNEGDVVNATSFGGSSVTDLEGVRFLYSMSNISKIVEITDIDQSNGEFDFKDIGSGKVYSNTKCTSGAWQNNVACNIDIFDSTFQLTLVNNTSPYTLTFGNICDSKRSDDACYWKTEHGAEIRFLGAAVSNVAVGNTTINIVEYNTGKEGAVALDTSMYVNFTYSSTNSELQHNVNNLPTMKKRNDADTYNEVGMTPFGTLIERYTKDQGDITFHYPKEEADGMVYVSPATATVTTTTAGQSCTVADISLQAQMASELSSASAHNLILVGGPCAGGGNSIVESLFMACEDWELAPGEAVIKLADNGDKVAMLVAGTEALDTRRASKVIANYGDYASDLAGKTEVKVSGTTLSDITVE